MKKFFTIIICLFLFISCGFVAVPSADEITTELTTFSGKNVGESDILTFRREVWGKIVATVSTIPTALTTNLSGRKGVDVALYKLDSNGKYVERPCFMELRYTAIPNYEYTQTDLCYLVEGVYKIVVLAPTSNFDVSFYYKEIDRD